MTTTKNHEDRPVNGLSQIDLSLIDDHPDNPRVVYRDDVIDGIAATLNGSYPQKHAIHLRPSGERFQLLGGHHRKRAAIKAKLKRIWAWVEELDDATALMELVLGNRQGELSPLEIGLHVLRAVPTTKGGRGKNGGLSAYAKRIGKSQQYVSQVRDAAEVAEAVKPTSQLVGLLEKAQHLAAIHKLRRANWPRAVAHTLSAKLSAEAVESRVKEARTAASELDVSGEWRKFMPVVLVELEVFLGASAAALKRLLDVACLVCRSIDDAVAEARGRIEADASIKDDDKPGALGELDFEAAGIRGRWISWLEANAGGDSWDIKRLQGQRCVVDDEILDMLGRKRGEPVNLVLADPPWRYEFSETDNRQIENQYPSAGVEDIIRHFSSQQMPPVREDCVLFMWATAPKLREALEVMEGWGFTYKTHGIWDKQKIGMGYWFRGQHELLLVGTRGEVSPPPSDVRVSSVFSEERGEHSEKPQCVYEWIERAFPGSKKLEMYARSQRAGWSTFGNEDHSGTTARR